MRDKLLDMMALEAYYGGDHDHSDFVEIEDLYTDWDEFFARLNRKRQELIKRYDEHFGKDL